MNKKLQLILTGAMSLAMLLTISACGSAPAEEAATEEETAEVTEVEEAPTEETAAEAGELTEYKSEGGWSVQYDPALVEVQSGGGAVDFLYTGNPDAGPEADLVTISVEADKQPEEVLYEITSNWEDQESITRSEGFFPGTEDQWGFWRTMDAPEDGSAPIRTAIAGEYNGGVLLLQHSAWVTGDEEADTKASDAMATIVDSLTYEDFQPQTMYDYVPGTYAAENTDGAIGEIVLNEDHTGVLKMQDDVDILWGSIELMAADGSFTYEYTIEGDSLMVNYDGQWLTFNK